MGRFVCANPGIPYGGLLEYSKWDLLCQLPTAVVPATVRVPMEITHQAAREACASARLDFPLYAKPDRGERGLLVSRIKDEAELDAYLDSCRAFVDRAREQGIDVSSETILLQAEATGRREFGVLYARMPGAAGGSITSVVEKELLQVVGDGEAKLANLIDSGTRTRLHRIHLREEFADRLSTVPRRGEVVPLVEVGNHVRGATFLDAGSLARPELAGVFDQIADRMTGFFIGRFDLRCESVDHLHAGSFQVVEVNGVNSEPAHIYDPSNRLLRAYRDLLHHWKLVHEIARANAAAGCAAPPARELIAAIARHARRRRLASRALAGHRSV
jgi:hypothetical protein